MAAGQTLTQSVNVNFTGTGSLPKTLKEMLDQTRQLEAASKAAAKAGDIHLAANLKGQAIGRGGFLESAANKEGIYGYRAIAESGEKENAKNQNQGLENIAVAAIYAAAMNKIKNMTALADPWALDRFNYALADLGAVIGRDLAPLLREATSVVRFMADAWIAIPGPIRQFTVLAVGATVATTGLVVAYNALVGSQILVAVSTVRASIANLTLAGSLNALGAAAMWSGKWLMRHPLIALGTLALGAAAVNNYQKDASYGAAVRNVSIGSVESYLDAVQTDVLKAGLSEEEKQTGLLAEIRDILGGGPKAVEVIKREAEGAIAGGVAPQIGRWIARQFD